MAQSQDTPPATDNVEAPAEETYAAMPTAETMLERLSEVDVERFDLKTVTDELKGNQAWLFMLTLPLSVVFLLLLTLIGTMLTDQAVLSFIVAAFLVFIAGKIIDHYEQNYRYQARLEVMDRIRQTEGELGLLPHFRDFLPKRYRHLWQSLKRYNYAYIDQYISAILLLQQRLEPDKFIRVWRLKHPETAPEPMDDDDPYAEQTPPFTEPSA